MGVFGKKSKLLDDGVRGTAVITRDERLDLGHSDSYSMGPLEERFGSYRYRFELEVTLDDGRPPYTVVDDFKVPGRLGGECGPGVVLPVAVDPGDPQRLVVDWDRFADEGGREQFEAAHQRKREANVQQAVAKADAEEAARLDAEVAAGKMFQAEADERKRMTAMASAGELDDEPGPNASPRETLEWQRAKGILDQATYDAILANNPDLK